MTANCITLHQPYASLVVAGIKTIETRSRRMNHRGRLYIHAAQRYPILSERWGEWRIANYYHDDIGDYALELVGPDLVRHPTPLGAVVGHVDVVGCLPMVARWQGKEIDCLKLNLDTGRWWRMSADRHPSEAVPFDENQVSYGDFTPGRWAILLENPVRYDEPIPATGKQGMWTWGGAS